MRDRMIPWAIVAAFAWVLVTGCSESSSAAGCRDGVDNDHDGLFDCDDPDCESSCGDDDDDDDTGDDDTGDDDTGDDDTTGQSVPGGPEVMNLAATPSTVAEDEAVSFTAMVTDEDGLDDLVGGQLTSHGGAVSHGTFAQIAGGTFDLSTSWDQINMAKAIEFDDQGTWLFTAVFSDSTGKEGTKGVEVTFTCGGSDACGGDCGFDLQSDVHNCGTCGESCDEACHEGGCIFPEWSACFHSSDAGYTCEDRCAEAGLGCTTKNACYSFAGYPACDPHASRECFEPLEFGNLNYVCCCF